MNDKSHVSLERRICLVCGVVYDTGSILLDKRMRASLVRYTTTGWACAPDTSNCATTASSHWSNATRSATVRRQRPIV